MAKTITSRLKLQQWSASTDTFVYVELNTALKSIEDLAAIDKQGAASARPSVGVRGTYFFATDTKVLYRDSGTEWVAINDWTNLANKPSLLALGTTATTAATGNHTHSWSSITGKPATSTLDGITIYNGDNPPSAGLGAVGDIYLEW